MVHIFEFSPFILSNRKRRIVLARWQLILLAGSRWFGWRYGEEHRFYCDNDFQNEQNACESDERLEHEEILVFAFSSFFRFLTLLALLGDHEKVVSFYKNDKLRLCSLSSCCINDSLDASISLLIESIELCTSLKWLSRWSLMVFEHSSDFSNWWKLKIIQQTGIAYLGLCIRSLDSREIEYASLL